MCVHLQYCNVYVTLPKLRELLTNTELQKECLDYVGVQGNSPCLMYILLRTYVGGSPSVANVFRLYSSLVAGLTVTDLCMHSNPVSMAVNERYAGLFVPTCVHLEQYNALQCCVTLHTCIMLVQYNALQCCVTLHV